MEIKTNKLIKSIVKYKNTPHVLLGKKETLDNFLKKFKAHTKYKARKTQFVIIDKIKPSKSHYRNYGNYRNKVVLHFIKLKNDKNVLSKLSYNAIINAGTIIHMKDDSNEFLKNRFSIK